MIDNFIPNKLYTIVHNDDSRELIIFTLEQKIYPHEVGSSPFLTFEFNFLENIHKYGSIRGIYYVNPTENQFNEYIQYTNIKGKLEQINILTIISYN